jgi:hypothetical protein
LGLDCGLDPAHELVAGRAFGAAQGADLVKGLDFP